MGGIVGVVGFGLGVSLGLGVMRVVGVGVRTLTGAIGGPALATPHVGGALIVAPTVSAPSPAPGARAGAPRRRRKDGGEPQRIVIAHE